MTSRVVYNSPSWFFSLTLFVVTRSEIMSDNEEMLGDFSSEESETDQYSDEEDAGGWFPFCPMPLDEANPFLANCFITREHMH